MAYTFNINGISVSADSPQEAIELAKLMAASQPQAAKPAAPTPAPAAQAAFALSPPPGPRPDESSAGAPVAHDKVVATVALLTAIKAAGHGGTGSPAIMAALDVSKPKGIGSKTSGINDYLLSLGFERDTAYVTERTPTGRVWRAGPRLDQALAKAREEILDEL